MGRESPRFMSYLSCPKDNSQLFKTQLNKDQDLGVINTDDNTHEKDLEVSKNGSLLVIRTKSTSFAL